MNTEDPTQVEQNKPKKKKRKLKIRIYKTIITKASF